MNELTITGVVLLGTGAALLLFGTLFLRIWHISVKKKAKRGRKGSGRR